MNKFTLSATSGIIQAHIGQTVVLTYSDENRNVDVAIAGDLESYNEETFKVKLTNVVHNLSGKQTFHELRFESLLDVDMIHFQDGSLGGK